MTKKKEPKEREKALVPVRRGGVVPREPMSDWGPFALMRRMREDMDRLMGEFLPMRWPDLGAWEVSAWAPRADLYETDTEVVVKAELPGVDPKDIEITTTAEAVTVRGEMKKEEEETKGGVHRAERRYGSFSRRFALPAGVEADKAKAAYKSGILEVRFPKTEKARGVKIKVEEGK